MSFRRFALAFSTAILAALLHATPGNAQGCSMCRDATAGSAPQVRAALRKAIPIMAVPAVALFVGVLVVAQRSRPGSNNPGSDNLGSDNS